jgi:hypothetical protein
VTRDWLRWRPGRIGSGYRKMLFARAKLGARGLLGFDVYLLDYPPGSSIPSHLDTVKLARHFRVNVVLRTGGSRYEGRTLWRLGERVIFFRPDRMTHGVPACARRRVVLSVGWAVRP